MNCSTKSIIIQKHFPYLAGANLIIADNTNPKFGV